MSATKKKKVAKARAKASDAAEALKAAARLRVREHYVNTVIEALDDELLLEDMLLGDQLRALDDIAHVVFARSEKVRRALQSRTVEVLAKGASRGK